jgi:hypothetical protein
MEPSKKQEKQETVVVDNYSEKMGHVQAQPHTHFRFKDKVYRQQLLDVIKGASTVGPIVASYDYGRKHNTDIIIRNEGNSDRTKPIGKIHLLLFDRRDRYNIGKYYIKFHLFQFANDELFHSVKQAVTTFFNSLPKSTESYGSSTRRNSKNINTTLKKNSKFDMMNLS